MNILQLKSGRFVLMQAAHEILASTLRHRQTTNTVAWNNHIQILRLTLNHLF